MHDITLSLIVSTINNFSTYLILFIALEETNLFYNLEGHNIIFGYFIYLQYCNLKIIFVGFFLFLSLRLYLRFYYFISKVIYCFKLLSNLIQEKFSHFKNNKSYTSVVIFFFYYYILHICIQLNTANNLSYKNLPPIFQGKKSRL